MAARYDGHAEYYDEVFGGEARAEVEGSLLLRLLGPPRGRLLDVGCGTGVLLARLAAAGWDAFGVDVSEDQLRLARGRGCAVSLADAAALPFADASFDAVCSAWTHTDVDDWAGVVAETARVLRPGGVLAYVGMHPCFVGPHSRFENAVGVPELHPGYPEARRYDDGPGISPTGLRARVGAAHLPLAELLQPLLDAGLVLDRIEEPLDPGRDYPFRLALRALRSER